MKARQAEIPLLVRLYRAPPLLIPTPDLPNYYGVIPEAISWLFLAKPGLVRMLLLQILDGSPLVATEALDQKRRRRSIMREREWSWWDCRVCIIIA